jgi:hypothetical protein
MAMQFDLIPFGTRVTAKGDGPAQDIGGSATRTFLCTLEIIDQLEQESIDLSIWGSANGNEWGSKPLLKIPQSFYRGHVRQVLDLALRPEVKFVRARWELTRWGRVAPTPMFVIGLRLEEVSAFAQAGAATKISTAG